MFEMFFFAAVCVIISPVSILTIILAMILNHTVFKYKYWGNLIVGLVGLSVAYIGYTKHTAIIPLLKTREIIATIFPSLKWDFVHIGIKEWILSDLCTIGAMTTLEMLFLYIATRTPENMIIEEERSREQAKMKKKRIDYIPTRSQVVFGVSGAGKSAYIGKEIEEILKTEKDAFIVVVDGKGSIEKYSLYYSCRKIAEKLGKRLIILNGTGNNDLGGILYDFLEGVEASDAMMDMVLSLLDDPTVKASSGSEHYKTMTQRYILKMIDFMRAYDIDVTLTNLMKILDPADLDIALDQININADKKSEIKKFTEDNWSDVRANVEKIKMFLQGQGKNIFTGNGERMNLRKAYENRDMVLVLADELSMPSLAVKLVSLVAYDLRNLVAERLTARTDMENKIFAFFDEFSSFTSAVPIIASLYARTRSADTIMTLATQSCSDIIGLGGGWFQRLIDTADRFVIFRQQSPEAAEAAASIFGTELHVTSTARSSELQATGEASNTADRRFTVSPDMIRNLPVNHGFLLDKTKKPDEQIKYFKNKFVK